MGNWETTTYGKIWYDEDVHYLRLFKTEFPAIVYNDALTSKSDFSHEPTVSKAKKSKMYYHFKIPNNNLDHGLQALGNDVDVINLVRYIDKYRLIEVFIKHEYTVLETYWKSPQKLRLEEIDDVESSALARKPFKKPGLKVNSSMKGNQFKELVWKCAAATIVPYFDKQIGKLKNLDEGAYEYLQKIPPQHWSRSHVSGRAHCDVLLNNLYKLFNRQLLDGRDGPIIKCLEFVKEYLMKRIVNVKKASKVRGSQALKVEGSQALKVEGSQASSVEGLKASSVGASKRTRGSQIGTSSAAKRSKLF
nr:transposase, mutator type [Tanacetum cinerariifolium]